MATRKEIRAEARARVAEEKAAKRARREELKAMSPEDRKAAKVSDRAAAREAKKAAKADRKAARASMSRAERREAKRRERAYRRVKNRPRRLIGWGVVVAIVAVIAVALAPIVRDISRLLSIEVDSTTTAGAEARENSAAVTEQISDEGIVLLENEGALPLAEDRVNVFSFASFNLRYGGAGSGGANQSSAITLYDALEQQGVQYNEDLYAAMEDAGAETTSGSSNGLIQIAEMLIGGGDATEPAPDYLTDDVLAQAREYADTALIVVGAGATEAADQTADSLRITDEQRELLDVVTANFDDVVVIVNSGNAMELGFLEEYPQITGAVWIGTPGPLGAVSLAKILAGDANPSGRLTDTYAYDVTSAPSVENLGDFRYENANRAVLEYEEGIYVGYRYYETRYAEDEAYDQIVQFPFGYGLSYTTFEWDASQPVVDDETVSIDVTVTNTGDVAGKDVVQVYYSAPYTPGGIEKSAIELGGYAKTSELEPGASETVTVTYDVRDMASWDQSGAGAYLLEAGDYDIVVATDVHSPLYTFNTTVADDVVYDTDDVTGVALENRFDFARGDFTSLSRDDWEGTYPDSSDVNLVASDELLEVMDPEIAPLPGEAPTYEADNGLMLADLKGLAYDDPQWDAFIDQLSVDEQISLFANGAYLTEEIERLGIPSAILLDGPAGLNYLFGEMTAGSFATEAVVAATWNDELAYALGEAVGAEANAYGVQGWYAPGMNLDRTAMGGRNFEYFSEDPLLSGKMSAAMVSGAQSKGVLTFMKHFALNEQEVSARAPGMNVFVDEQALRELYLRPFEITVKEGDANGAMSSFINIGGRWSGGNEVLLEEVLRGEWGFDGVVSTDAVLGGFMDPTLAVRYGNDLMLAMLPSSAASSTKAALEDDPVGVGEGLRDRVHNVLYALLQTDLFD
ncbi:glycoside hydrolase family 3 N-terminal domain-containing protein [Microbacterium sp. C7(2022)]|uniref:glycoside hydrolase family 3 protein n=1 Tax=Microbacterium sp. C7(2022) TaxID=2992759 RepID=UPI00237A2CE6|nr:glycoside hydrolase family 3 protein [Microbacterium sp. C7(2022)]MDE0546235.1 glycoside hydrolase family 3 C-terminal domain-containing protein [Microbacterium sp. C7(2022)]